MLTVTFDQRMPSEVPPKLHVYTAKAPPAATAEFDAVARAWPGATLTRPGKVRRLVEWTSADFGQLRLLYNNISGALTAEVRRGAGVREGHRHFPLTDDRAAEIARAFLAKAKLVDEDASKLVVAKVTHLRRQSATGDGTSPAEVLDAGVVLTRRIDDLPIVGPGGHVMVKVLPNSAIAGASRVFRRRGPKVATIRTRPPSDALAEFDTRLRKLRRLDGHVRVLRAEFGYFEAGRSHRQRFFEPAYTFIYETEGEYAFKSAEVVPASRTPREKWPAG